MKKNRLLLILTFLVGILGRAIPHPWNLTPTVSLSLISGQYFRKKNALMVTLLSLLVSDCLLAVIQHHAVFGSWSLFTYTGLLLTTLIAQQYNIKTASDAFLLVSISSLTYWAWTNVGCWLSMPEYPTTFQGLWQCFTMALPFLKNQIIGDLLWFCAFNYFLRYNHINAIKIRNQLG